MATLYRDLKWKNILLAQKSWDKWIKEGDCNLSYFHSCINRRRKTNELVGVSIDGQWLEEVDEVKNGILEFFS